MRQLLQKLVTILAWPAGACSNLESDFIFIALLSLLLCYLIYLPTSQADVGWLSVNVAKSLRAFVESVFANSRVKNIVFTIQGKKAIYSCQYTGAVIG